MTDEMHFAKFSLGVHLFHIVCSRQRCVTKGLSVRKPHHGSFVTKGVFLFENKRGRFAFKMIH